MADWSGDGNGRIAQSKLASDGQGGWLEPHAAADLITFAAAFQKQFGKQLVVTCSYRPLGPIDAPPDPHGGSQWGSWHWYQEHGSPVAAVPGTSNHGEGQAVDLGSSVNSFGTPEHDWAVANGPDFGWVWGSTPSEPWHFDHLDLTTHTAQPASVTAPAAAANPLDFSPEEDDMPLGKILNTRVSDTGTDPSAGTVWYVSPSGITVGIKSTADLDILQRLIADRPGERFNKAQWDRLKAYLRGEQPIN